MLKMSLSIVQPFSISLQFRNKMKKSLYDIASFISFSGNVQMNDALPLYLEAVCVIVSSLSVAIRQEKDFINVLW